MAELGNKENKNILLEQIKSKQQEVASGSMNREDFVKLLKDLIHNYSDLNMEDYKGWINDETYRLVEESLRDPEELQLWLRIASASEYTETDIQNKLQLVMSYISKFYNAPKIGEAKKLQDTLNQKMNGLREQHDWDKLDKTNYVSLLNYKLQYPQSVHNTELDELMWKCTEGTSTEQLNRYLRDWRQEGRHVNDAERILEAINDWGGGIDPKWNDIFQLKKFLDTNSSFPLISEVRAKYNMMRNNLQSDMLAHAEKYSKNDLDELLRAGVFSNQDFVAVGISGGTVVDLKQLPDLEQFAAHPNFEAKPGCTDIYLFGVPGTGKTCLLMGLTGAEGSGYTINFREKGGPYASALKQYVDSGVTPKSTPGKYVTTIKSVIEEERMVRNREVFLNHHINFVEMSGEEFAHKIANSDEKSVKLSDMGDGTRDLLRNSNRKVFFIIIDPTVDTIEFKFNKYDKDENGNIVGVRPVTEYINQLSCISKFVDLFEADENKEFMKKVDGIHFIVTKADTLGGDDEIRKRNARDLMIRKYEGPVRKLIGYCRRTKRVNYATDFCPMVYPFSLGRFFVGGSFKYDNRSTKKIINVIRYNTAAKIEESFIDKIRDFLA